MRDWRSHARYKQLPPDDPRHGYAQQVTNRKGETVELKACQCHKDGPPGPDNLWNIWLLMSGRGFGKTWVGASWLYEQAMTYPGSEWCCIAPTFSQTRRVCIEGSTGLIRAMHKEDLLNYRRNDLEIELTNGSKIFGFSADQPDRVRGANLWGAWLEEVGSW